MTVKELATKFEYEILCLPDPNKLVEHGYTGDLLSWVMGRLDNGSAWVTIMSNINIVAVAALSDPACIVLSENVTPDDGVLERAMGQGINILRTKKSSFEVCADLSQVL